MACFGSLSTHFLLEIPPTQQGLPTPSNFPLPYLEPLATLHNSAITSHLRNCSWGARMHLHTGMRVTRSVSELTGTCPGWLELAGWWPLPFVMIAVGLPKPREYLHLLPASQNQVIGLADTFRHVSACSPPPPPLSLHFSFPSCFSAACNTQATHPDQTL